MKHYLYILEGLLITILTFTGCNKWLDISPVDEVSKKDMYKNTEGFYNVLNGIYQDLGESGLYGQNLSWGAMEAWGRGYALKTTVGAHETFVSLDNYRYTDKKVVSLTESLWLNMYKNIARANEFIQSCSEKPDDFFNHGEIEKKLLLGEAYAIRAFLHFDLLRIFAQTPAKDGEKEKAYIPYVEKYPSKINPPMKTSDVLQKIMTDLEVAADNVGAYDTLDVNKDYALSSTYRFSEGNTPSWGRFYSQRGSRLNYYAIRMLQARVALYDGDYEKAKDVSGKLVQLVTDKEFSMESAYSIANNPKIMKEVLFAFYNENLIDNTQDCFNYTNTQVLKVEDPALFTAISSDKRSGLVKNATLTVFNADKNGSVENYIPAIRMSEAYYILAESMAKTGDLKGAIKTFNVFAKQRGMTSASSRIPENAEMDVFTDFLIKDARKEFAGLGQNVFMYKRLNIPVQYSKGNVPESFEVLVLPVPSTENAI